jgi:hypothetical protein
MRCRCRWIRGRWSRCRRTSKGAAARAATTTYHRIFDHRRQAGTFRAGDYVYCGASRCHSGERCDRDGGVRVTPLLRRCSEKANSRLGDSAHPLRPRPIAMLQACHTPRWGRTLKARKNYRISLPLEHLALTARLASVRSQDCSSRAPAATIGTPRSPPDRPTASMTTTLSGLEIDLGNVVAQITTALRTQLAAAPKAPRAGS